MWINSRSWSSTCRVRAPATSLTLLMFDQLYRLIIIIRSTREWFLNHSRIQCSFNPGFFISGSITQSWHVGWRTIYVWYRNHALAIAFNYEGLSVVAQYLSRHTLYFVPIVKLTPRSIYQFNWNDRLHWPGFRRRPIKSPVRWSTRRKLTI